MQVPSTVANRNINLQKKKWDRHGLDHRHLPRLHVPCSTNIQQLHISQYYQSVC